MNQRPPHACAAAAAPRRRSALAPAATHSGRKSCYRSNLRGPPRSSESSRSRLQHVRTGTRLQLDRRAIIANHRSRPRLHCRAGLPAEIEPGDLLAIQAPSRCFRDPAMGKKASRNPTSIGSASKLPSQLRIRRTSPHAAAVRSRLSARDLQRRAECSRRTNARYASNASHRTLAARTTRSHLTHPQVLGHFGHRIAAAADDHCCFAAGNRLRTQVSAKRAASSPL